MATGASLLKISSASSKNNKCLGDCRKEGDKFGGELRPARPARRALRALAARESAANLSWHIANTVAILAQGTQWGCCDIASLLFPFPRFDSCCARNQQLVF